VNQRAATFRARVDDEVGPLSGIHEFSDVVALQFKALAKGEHPAHSRPQDLREAALANHQDPFVIADENTAQHKISTSSRMN
jgi:hypothetical protein